MVSILKSAKALVTQKIAEQDLEAQVRRIVQERFQLSEEDYDELMERVLQMLQERHPNQTILDIVELAVAQIRNLAENGTRTHLHPNRPQDEGRY